MALTIAVSKSDIWGSQKVAQATVAFDSSYPTGGEEVTASLVAGFTAVSWVQPDSASDVATKIVRYIPSTNKLQIFIQDAISGLFDEAGNGTDQSAVDINALIFGY